MVNASVCPQASGRPGNGNSSAGYPGDLLSKGEGLGSCKGGGDIMCADLEEIRKMNSASTKSN